VFVITIDGFYPRSIPVSVELLYLTALVGCGASSAFAPVGRWFRLGIFVITIGLFAIQFLLIGIVAIVFTGLDGIQ
jgi:hypothetical protein